MGDPDGAPLAIFRSFDEKSGSDTFTMETGPLENTDLFYPCASDSPSADVSDICRSSGSPPWRFLPGYRQKHCPQHCGWCL